MDCRNSKDRLFMQEALAQASLAASAGEVPVGAVIVAAGQIVAAAHNEVEAHDDVTAHAELLAIQRACRKCCCRYLEGMTLYVTLEPCPLCAGAILLSRLSRVVYGAPDLRMGAMETVFAISGHPYLHRQLELRGGVAEEASQQLLQEFFRARRD